MLASVWTGALAQDATKPAWMPHIAVDCASFYKFGANWITLKDTVVAISVQKREGTVSLDKGTAVNLLLTDGIYLGEILDRRCPKPAAPATTTTASAAVPVPGAKPAPKAYTRPHQRPRGLYVADY